MKNIKVGEKYRSRSASQTKRLGEKMAHRILEQGRRKKALVVALTGELGGGKTTFIQGFARGLGVAEKILSPTFVILKRFEVPNPRPSFFYHLDCYRIHEAKEILDLGFKKIISNPGNIAAVEWAYRIKNILPEDTVGVHFEIKGKEERIIRIKWPNKKK